MYKITGDFFFLSENVLKTCSKNCHPFVEKKKMSSSLTMSVIYEKSNKKRANSGWKSLSLRYNLGGKTWVQRYTSRESVTLAFISCLSPQQNSRSGYWNTLYVTLCWSYRCHKVDLVLSIIRVCARKWRGSKKTGKDFLFVTGLIIFRRVFQEKITCLKIKRFTISDIVQYSTRDIAFEWWISKRVHLRKSKLPSYEENWPRFPLEIHEKNILLKHILPFI